MDINDAKPVNEQPVDDQNDVNTEAQVPETEDDLPAKSVQERQWEKEAREKAEAEEPASEETEEAPEEETEDENKDELDTSVWGDTGDEVANSVLLTLQNSGVSTSDAKALLWDAVEAGDPSQVDKDALIEKVGKTNATLVMAGIENVTSRNNERIAEVKEMASKAAGGTENWNKAASWARENLSDKDLDEFKSMLDKGGRQADYAAKSIVDLYNNDPKNTALNAGTGQVKPEGKAKPKIEGITRLQYGQELLKLEQRRASPAEFNELSKRRQAGIKAGI